MQTEADILGCFSVVYVYILYQNVLRIFFDRLYIKTHIIVCKEMYTCKYIAHIYIYIMHTGIPKCMKHAHMSSPALFELGG